MTAKCTTLLRAAVIVAALIVLPILVAAKPVPVWDQGNVPIPCGGQQVVPFNPSTHQSALARYDDATRKVVTVVVFFDESRQEVDGKAYRYHFSTPTAGLTWEIHSADVTVRAEVAPCMTGPGAMRPGQPRVPPTATPVPPTPTRVPPTATPIPAWQFNLVVPCGQDPSISYNRTFGFTVTWLNSLHTALTFDAWQDAQHIAGSGHDRRWTVTTDHGFQDCALFYTDHGTYVSFEARHQNGDE